MSQVIKLQLFSNQLVIFAKISKAPGAVVAGKFSAKWVMFFSVFINVVCTLLTPFAANTGVWTVVIMRVLEGIGGGVTFPAEHTMIS